MSRDILVFGLLLYLRFKSRSHWKIPSEQNCAGCRFPHWKNLYHSPMEISGNSYRIFWSNGKRPWFTVYFFDIGHPCSDQLTLVKTRYPLTSFTWPYRGLKFRAHRGHVFIDVYCWPSAGFQLDRELMSGKLVKNRARLFGSWLTLTQD